MSPVFPVGIKDDDELDTRSTVNKQAKSRTYLQEPSLQMGNVATTRRVGISWLRHSSNGGELRLSGMVLIF